MKQVKKISKKQEQRITRSLKEIKEDAKQTMNSGAIWFDKSDVVSKKFRVEAKTKAKPSKSILIKKAWLEKIEKEAFLTGKIPTLAFSFGDGIDYFILRDRDFYSFIEKINQEDTDSGE